MTPLWGPDTSRRAQLLICLAVEVSFSEAYSLWTPRADDAAYRNGRRRGAALVDLARSACSQSAALEGALSKAGLLSAKR